MRATIEDRSLVAIVIVMTLIGGWIISPFFGAIMWSIVVAMIFTPLCERLTGAMRGRKSLAAMVTLLVIVAMVILPAILLAMVLLQEAAMAYDQIRSGQIDLADFFNQFREVLPGWMTGLLERLGLGNFKAVSQKATAGFASSLQPLAAQAYSLSQSALGFAIGLGVMLYLTFFLLRDGKAIVAMVERAVPLRSDQRRALLVKFGAVIRATVKGSIVVAILQGTIGGLVFWALDLHAPLLWGTLMGVMSLLPAIGTGLIWIPVAIFLLLSGSILQGVILIFCGLFVIGTVDNILKPILVGRDAHIPDYVVLVSTLGGLEIFGFNGFVIGPVIAALFIAIWEIFTDYRDSLDPSDPEQAV